MRVIALIIVMLSGLQVSFCTPLTFTVMDKARLQRGAKLYMNYCSGCHSLQYLRYKQMAKDLGITTRDGQIDTSLVKNNLIFTEASLDDPIKTALPEKDAKQWFGMVPPDLSLTARVRGADWIFNYLKGFYKDNTRPFGANNLLIPEAAMPNSLEPLIGEAILAHNNHSSSLLLINKGELSQQQMDSFLQDLVTFLVYASEPARLIRYHLGVYVLGFLSIFLLIMYSLKKCYWKNIK